MLRRLRSRLGPVGIPDVLATPKVIAAKAASAALAGRVSALCGWSLQETTEAAGAKIRLRDGNGGTVLANVSLLPGESADRAYPIPLMVPSASLYIEVVAGSIEGSAHVL